MDFLNVLIYLILLVLAVQAIRLLFADGDLTLMWKERFGNKPDVLARQVVWITGASMGIGEYFAYEMAKAGCRIVLSGRSKELLDAVKRKCISFGKVSEKDVLVLPFDILDLSCHREMTENVLKNFGQIDILVNNAGRSQRARLLDTELEVDRQLIELNVISQVSLTKSVLPHMVKRGQGRIVINSSVAGKIGTSYLATYSLTKFAVLGWHQALGFELCNKNIAVTVVCPGPIMSNILKNAFTEKSGEKYGINASIDDKARMSTERCAWLMAVGVANKLNEIWIARQPVLALVYLAQYAPFIAHKVVNRVSVAEFVKVDVKKQAQQ